MLKSFLSLFEYKFSKENILNQLEVAIATVTGFWKDLIYLTHDAQIAEFDSLLFAEES
ncbi:hypothetical protein H2661_10230 [Vibrio cholerae]|uniref:hypothetical protein n=1 Tax=Vibrio cholerae TaxID=666 RepID=UPI002FDC5947